jgi:AhpD family alkylhydroperoxidase
MPRLDTFRRERERLNARVLERATLETKRFFSLDGQCYRDGALPARTKELLGLVASLVLRCDDCVSYHLIRCAEEGVGDAEVMEALNVGLVVGGSIVIPHLRHAVDFLDEIRAEAAGRR